MNYCSYFLKDKALFGGYPDQSRVDELENNNVRYFVNLTHSDERYIQPYKTNYTYISFPIYDRNIPKNLKQFSVFILELARIIKTLSKSNKMYIHCRGGHGRCGIVVACLLCYIMNITPADALKRTNHYHSNRVTMRNKWRKIGSPQTKTQKTFVIRFFEPLYFYKSCNRGKTVGMSNFSNFSVSINGIGSFHTSEAAFQAFKNITDKAYVKKQLEMKNPITCKYLGNSCVLTNDWYRKRDIIMYNIIWKKFQQHKKIRDNLLSTGLRPIIMKTRNDRYWGCGFNGDGSNILGKIFKKIRHALYMNR